MQASLIICTLNRREALINCLNSLARALDHAAPIDAEIIIVDNGSSDDTQSAVAAWSQTCAYPVRFFLETRRGAAKARNRGTREATGAQLFYIDDDCIAEGDYIKKGLSYTENDAAPVLRSGRVKLGDPSDLPITIIAEPDVKRALRSANTARHVNMGNTFLSCNMMMPKSLADAVGLLDERLGAGTNIPGGEDIDFAFRAYLAGYLVEYVPDMTVHHFHGRKHKAEGKKLFRNYSLGGGALLAKYAWRHPNLCRQFWWDIKNAWKEIFTGTNRNMPQIDFSYKEKVLYQLLGVLLFLRVAVLQRKKPVEPGHA